MFKALVLTQMIIKHPQSTLNRQIISQEKETLEYSPGKSPSKQQPQTKETKIQPLKLTEIQATVKLFHQYQLQRAEGNFNQLLIDSKAQETAALAHLKTKILAIVNVSSVIDKEAILQKLSSVREEIGAVDVFVQKDSNEQEDNPKDCLKPEIPSSHVSYTIIAYFHTSIICQELYEFSYKHFSYLPFYLKQVVILQRNSSQQISYNQILTTFSHIQPLNLAQNSLSNLQAVNSLQNQDNNWIQLPQCVHCLLKLEFQVTGIHQKVLYRLAANTTEPHQTKPQKSSLNCPTCQILAQHRKQGEIHRKLSSSSDHKDHTKTNQAHAHCDDCKEKTDIWICMVCSRVGCGRYKNADAYKHFVKSGHIITIDLETERVWNYMSDCFSHKLLKNINETANVKFPEISKDQSEKIEQSKLQAAFWKYCSVFSEEMQRQRVFYQNIKLSQEQKFRQQDEKLDTIIKQLQKEKEEKSLQLKKTLKKKAKAQKKEKQLEGKVSQEREILKEQEECIGADWVKNSLENDEDVKRKKKELEELDKQLNEVLAQLSQS